MNLMNMADVTHSKNICEYLTFNTIFRTSTDKSTSFQNIFKNDIEFWKIENNFS